MRYRTMQNPTAFRRMYNYSAKVLENIEQLSIEQQRQRLDMLTRAVTRINI